MDYLQELIRRYPELSGIKDAILNAASCMIRVFESGGKLLVAGNGGSAADCEHIVGELMKSFVKKRTLPAAYTAALAAINPEIARYLGPRIQPGLPAIALTGHAGLSSATLNDIDGAIVYAQQLYGYGKSGDLFIGISTSGNAKNVVYAAVAAKAKGMTVIALSGGTGGELVNYADVAIMVPETETYKIQELHLPIYHTLCLMTEDHFFP
ncbi:MAG: SIS domain-containing protein [Treponema sp.]|jgi:D-sedoheptulose 7-phosphate isomerase|nr:SIS domain-containing protein [Treponema sp.]